MLNIELFFLITNGNFPPLTAGKLPGINFRKFYNIIKNIKQTFFNDY